MKGLRVVRGPDWKWGDSDGGVGHVGTVIDFDEDEKTATVIWDSASSEIKYRAGMNGAFDLCVLDNAQTAVIHRNFSCDKCEERGIKGLRWKCAVCPDYDLCSTCYHSDKHRMSHKFLRYNTDKGMGKPTLMPARKRCQSDKKQSQGIFIGAIVSKGVHWSWKNEDEGDGAIGLVIDIEDWGITYRSKAQVMWANKTCFNYRVGHQGIVDLTCKLAADGGQYYEGHLPILGKDTMTSKGPVLTLGYMDQHLHMIEQNISFNVSTVMKALQEYRTLMVEDSNILPGIRVVRGPDWVWDDQDGGEGYVGTVFYIDPSNLANVVWDNGSKFSYRIGNNNNFDLRILDTAPSGMVHKTVKCNSCQCCIQGIRWECTSCYDFDLCSACYNSDQHDTTHTFWRYHELSENRVLVPCRSNSVKIMSRGIFKDAIVCRGTDWQCGEQDVIDAVLSSQGTEPPQVDTDHVLLKRKITYSFTNLIQPLDILSVFHKYNLLILTEREIEDIRVETNNKGRFKGAEMLLDKLYKYKGWFQCLLNVLRDEKVKLQDLANSLEKLKDDLLQETVSQASGLQSDHPQPVQTKSYGQGLVLSINSWNETANCAARVQWANHSQFEYRVGYMGKVDLTLVKASDGGYYYRDHLPILGKTDTEEECEPKTANICQCSQEELATDSHMLLKVENLKILMRQAHIEDDSD